ncbi:MAG: alpha/beta hydrolase [bacterium]|nr:alpha/beta hydrolase [bacterium]
MDLSQAHPDLRGYLRWIPAIPYHLPVVRRALDVLVRLCRIFEFKGDENIKVRWVQHGESASKIYQPVAPASDSALLWIHGGGYILGEAYVDDDVCRRMADELGITIVSAEYRLAPKYPFPAPLDDCAASWQWIQGHAAELGVNSQRVIVAGESAGGGLTAALVQRLHDEGGQQPLAQILLSPMLDDRTVLREELTRENHFIWNNRNNRGGWQCYLGQEPGLPDVPSYSVPARRESLAGLPPAWLSVGTIDVFVDENIAYVEKLKAYGVACELLLTEGGCHSFESFWPNVSISKSHWESLSAFMRRVINGN